MNTFTIEDIRKLNPCYNPSKFLPETWTGTALDILNVEACPAEDRLWVVCHDGWIYDRTLRLFAVWCARQVEHLMTDERSKTALNVAERYANGQATDEELAAARAAARAAANAAWAAENAAWAAENAARAAENAAWDTADYAARAAAMEAAMAAARAAADYAARAAADYAAWDAARAAQVNKLIEMIGE